MVNTFKTHEVEVILVNEEHSINFETLDLNLTQQLKCEKEPPKKVMHTKVDQLMWDCPPLPFNVHTLAIYLEFCSYFMKWAWEVY